MKRTFNDFMAAVDAEIIKVCGLSYDDLPDYLYGDDYDDGFTPKQTAKHALRNAGAF